MYYEQGIEFSNSAMDELLDELEGECSLEELAPNKKTTELAPPVIPSFEEPDQLSDEDSDPSDTEATGSHDHLPHSILEIECETKINDFSTFKKRKMFIKTAFVKIKNKKETFKIPEIIDTNQTNTQNILNPTINSPIAAFVTFFTDNLLSEITKQTNLYASQKGNYNLNATKDEIQVLIGIILYSGYISLPSKRMFWNSEEDCSFPLITNAIRRRRFEDLLRFFHLADNSSNKDTDQMFKVRLIFDELNAAFKKVTHSENFYIDENIIPYFRHHDATNLIKGKQSSYGYKVCCLAASDGVIQHVEPYCSSLTTNNEKIDFHQKVDLILHLLKMSNLPSGTKLFIDHQFVSDPLINGLALLGFEGIEILKKNNITDNMYHSKKKASELQATSSSTREIFATNNKTIIGVDLCNQFVSKYSCRIRSKKWWWPFFAWCVDLSCVQGWLLYRKLGHDIPLLQFRRQCTIFILKSYGSTSKLVSEVKPSTSKLVAEELRYDGKNHLIQKGNSKYRRCKVCGNRTSFVCQKCDEALHPSGCFETFHKT